MAADDLLMLSELLDEAFDLDERARTPWLADLHRTQPKIAARLEALLQRTHDLKTDHLLVDGGRSVTPQALSSVMESDRTHASEQTFLLQTGAGIGPYRLIKPLGEGGMASVWLAERSDGQLKREVALKLLHAWRNSHELVERFARERDMLAGLVHPHIARLYDAGITEAGQPWIALEYVQGVDLATYADKNCLTVRARIEAMLQVMSAVQHAHQNLIVHRDLKPTNILVNEKGDVRLLDFGIAKLLQANDVSAAETELTRNAGRALTLRYAAPEQIKGDPITTATDVYALGLVLYELLTGTSPRTGTKTQVIAEQAALSTDILRASRANFTEETSHHRGDISTSELKTELSGDLDTILLKALARDPARRYRTVDAFAADLHAWLERRPIAARAPSFAYQLRMFLVRQRVPVAIGCVMFLVLGASGVFAWKQRLRAEESQARSQEVQKFMANLLTEAEPDGVADEQALTTLGLLNAGVASARRDYAANPVLRAQLLGELARPYLRIGEEKIGEKLLNETIALLEAHAPRDEPSLHAARVHLASMLIDRREYVQARDLLNRVLSNCVRRTTACDKARGLAHFELSRPYDAPVSEKRKHLDAALAILSQETNQQQQALAQTRILLASLERSEGNFSAARSQLNDVESQFSERRPKSPERSLYGTVRAQLAFDEGEFTQAADAIEQLLADLQVSKRDATRLYLHTFRAHVANYEGLSTPAFKHAAAARLIAADNPPLDFAYTLRYNARALSMAGDYANARRSIDEALALLKHLKIDASDSAWFDMLRASGEVAARANDHPRARRELEATLDALNKYYPAEFRDKINCLDLLGALALAMGDVDIAIQHHTEEVALLNKKLPASHPLRLRAELQLARANYAHDGNETHLSKMLGLSALLKQPLKEGSVHLSVLGDLEESIRRKERQTKLTFIF